MSDQVVASIIAGEAGEAGGGAGLLENVAGSFAAEGLAARLRLEDDPELAEAFAALDEGETERGLDALIQAIAASDEDRREDLRRAVVGVLDDLVSSIRWRASRAASSPPRCTRGQSQLADRRDGRRRRSGSTSSKLGQPHAEQPHRLGGA